LRSVLDNATPHRQACPSTRVAIGTLWRERMGVEPTTPR